MANAKDLLQTAQRVLVAWNTGRRPAEVDVEELQLAFPTYGRIPAHELAFRVFCELGDRAIREG